MISATLYQASHTRFDISTILHGIWLPISIFIRFQTFSMRFMSGKFPVNSSTGIPLQCRNILVLLELWHGARSCLKIYPFCLNTTHLDAMSISWIISLWYFALSMLPLTFLWRDRPLLLMAPQTWTLAGNFTVVWIHLAWYFAFCLRQTRQWRQLLWLWNTD